MNGNDCIQMQNSNNVKRSRGALQQAHHHTQPVGASATFFRPRPSILQKRRPSRPESGAEQRAGDTQTHAIIHPKRIQRHCGNFTSHAWPCGSERRRIDLCLFRGCRRRRHVGRLPPPPHFTASSALAPA
jgi:hypothetical protein